jgi:hypothetical protein
LDDRTKLIASKTILVNKAVKNIIKRHPNLGYLADDLRAAGKLGLLDGINKAESAGQSISDAALMKRIKGAIYDTVQELSDALPIPRSSKRLAAKNGQTIDPTFVDKLPADFDIEDRRAPSLMSQVSECCATTTEKAIVTMLGAGYNQRQIATRLQTDFRRVNEIIQTIKQRFDDDEDGIDEPYIPVPKGRDGKCRCGQLPARWNYGNDDRCEECYADDSQRWNGRSQRVRVTA